MSVRYNSSSSSGGSPCKQQKTESSEHAQSSMSVHYHSSSSSGGSPCKKQRTESSEDSQRAGESEHLSDSDESEDEFARPVMGLGASNSNQKEEDPSVPPDVTSDFLMKKTEKPVYNTFAEKMMAKMGYKKGKGLGKHGQGRVEIVTASKQKGRRGLGHIVANFEPSDVEWNYEKEEISANEQVEWITPCQEDIPSVTEMKTWVEKGLKQHNIEDDYEFCSKQIVETVLKCKSVFDHLEPEEMRRARTKSNPYETIRGAFFQNRAAMKMANLDAVCDFMFTNPVDENGKSLLASGELLYFADVCAGPGGFSEYILWKKNWDAKGFGFTLKGANDFKLEEFFAASSELFEPHYGVDGLDGDGDVFKPENLTELRKFVMESTDGKGVHFVMADGGFDVSGQENLQEWLSKRLYLCECIAALSILRTGGHFVCKLFDIFLPYSVGLIYLMYRAFREVSIFKPVTSRPANSERYIICKGLRPGAEAIHDFMFDVNLMFNEFGVTSNADINYIVPLDVMRADEEFDNYMTISNKTIGIKQSISLTKIKAFAQNSALYEIRQAEMREECLKLWQVPDQLRKAPDKSKAHEKFMSLLKVENTDCFNKAPEQLTMETIEGIKSIYDYRCYVTASEKRCYLLGQGKSYVFQWDGQPKRRWQKVDDMKVELPMNTLLEVEYVQELRGEGKGQRRVIAIHVIDAMVLGGVDIRDLHFTERLEKLNKFVKAITRPTRSDLVPIRVKELHRFEELESVFNSLDMKQVKGCGSQPRLCYCGRSGRHFVPAGITFVKTVKEPWMMAHSKSKRCKYFFNTITRKSLFETPKDAIAPFTSCQSDRWVWLWNEGVRIHDLQKCDDPAKVSKERIIEFINKRLGR